MWEKVISAVIALGFMAQRAAKRIDQFLSWFPKYLRRRHEKSIDKTVDSHNARGLSKWLRYLEKKRNRRRDES